MQHNIAAGNRAQLTQLQQRNNLNPYGIISHPYSHQNQRNLPGANTMVHQSAGMVSGISNSYIGTTVYNAQPVAHSVQPVIASTPVSNLSDSAQILSTSLTHSNITFRQLPFYKLKYEILKPTVLNANSLSSLPPNVRTSATQEFQLTFVLSCAMASELAMNRDTMKNEYIVQAQLRITAIDTNNSAASNTAYDDFLPLGLVVRVNGRQLNNLPPCSPSTRQGTESRRIPRPISVTHLIKMSPMNVNHLVINWALETGKTYVITLNLVEKLTSGFLLDKLKEQPKISVDITKLMIREQYKRVIDDDDDDSSSDNADDDDIATTIVRVSLLCPLVKFRMRYPAKGKNCSHLQCFDGAAYISLNEKKPAWNCPVCNRPLYYDDLLLDQYFLDVLQNEQLSPNCQEVQLLVDGSWKSYDEGSTAESKNDRPSTSSAPTASSSMSPLAQQNTTGSGDLVSEDIERKTSSSLEAIVDNTNANSGPIVDLTSDEEGVSDEPVVREQLKAAISKENENSVVPSVPANITVDSNKDVAKENESLPPNAENRTVENMENTEAPSLLGSVVTTSDTTTSSTAVSSSGYTSPHNIISLDSPSPPTFSSPTPTTLAALNIGN